MSSSGLAEFNGVLLDGLVFCSRVYSLFESIRSEENGRSKLRMRKSHTHKKVIEELLPICSYLQTHYRIGRYISVKWMDGSQSFDAEVIQSGDYISQNYYPSNAHLEVTNALHPNEYLSRELLDKKGVAFSLDGIKRLKSGEIESEPIGYTNDEHVQQFSKILLDRITEKSNKQYPSNTTLIICCTLNTIYYEDEWNKLVSIIKKNLPESNFDEIYLYDSVGCFNNSLYPSTKASL